MVEKLVPDPFLDQQSKNLPDHFLLPHIKNFKKDKKRSKTNLPNSFSA